MYVCIMYVRENREECNVQSTEYRAESVVSDFSIRYYAFNHSTQISFFFCFLFLPTFFTYELCCTFNWNFHHNNLFGLTCGKIIYF